MAELAGADVDRPGDDLAPGVTIAATYAQDLALIASALLLARWLDGPVRAARFGFRPTPFGSALGWLVLTWVRFIAFSYVWSIALDIQEPDDLPDELGAGGSTAALVAVALLVCVMAPIAEELFFRGFVFTAFRRTLGLPVAAILTGAIFGAIHLGGTEIEFIVPLAVFGALLCLLYVWTDSLLPCIVLHALNNGLALGVAEDWGAWTPVAMLGAAALCLLITLPVVPDHGWSPHDAPAPRPRRRVSCWRCPRPPPRRTRCRRRPAAAPGARAAQARAHAHGGQGAQGGPPRLRAPGRLFKVRGTMTPLVAAPRQRVRLHLFRDGKPLRKVRATVHRDGTFVAKLKGGRAGRLSVRVFHEGSASWPRSGARRWPWACCAPRCRRAAPDRWSGCSRRACTSCATPCRATTATTTRRAAR